MLEEILPRDSHFNDFEVDHEFEGIGRRSMLLNARRLPPAGGRPGLILLAIEDVTERRRAADALALSETRYRRLFETAQDGILIVDPDTRRIFDANPFLTDLLGYTRDELVGKELWEIGLFRDIEASKAAFRTLQEKGYIRYEDLPLRTHDGRGIEVEFVSNVYDVGDTRVIQCNIRDVTDRKRAEDALRAAHDQLEARVEERTAELARSNEALTAEIARRGAGGGGPPRAAAAAGDRPGGRAAADRPRAARPDGPAPDRPRPRAEGRQGRDPGPVPGPGPAPEPPGPDRPDRPGGPPPGPGTPAHGARRPRPPGGPGELRRGVVRAVRGRGRLPQHRAGRGPPARRRSRRPCTGSSRRR